MANTEIDSLSLDIQIKGINKDDLAKIDKLSRAVARLTKSLKDADFSKLEQIKLPKGIHNIQFLTQNFREVTSGGATSGGTSELKSEIQEIGNVADNVTTKVENNSLVVESSSTRVEKASRKAKKALKEAEDAMEGKGKKSNLRKELNRLEKTFRRFKTVAFVKAIRGILNAIVGAIKSGATNLASFDKEFNDTMSKIKTSATTTINGIGLAIRPIIEQLQPFLTYASNLVAQLGNEVSKINAMLKGQNSYTKTNAKYMEDFAKSSQKASLFSFDTFNTLDTQSSDMYETATISEEDTENGSALFGVIAEIKELMSKISAIATYVTNDVLKKIKLILPAIEGILGIVNEIIDAVNPLIEGINEALEPIFNTFLGELFPAIISLVGATLQPLFNAIKTITPIITTVIGLIADVLEPVMEVIMSIIDEIMLFVEPINAVINWIIEQLGSALTDILKIIADLLKPIIQAFKDIKEIIDFINVALEALFNGDWEGFAKNFEKAFKKIGETIVRFFAGLLDGIINAFIGLINIIIANDVVKTIAGWFGGEGWKGIEWRSDLASQIPSFANGGVVGEVWQMNEYGNAEMLYNSNSGNTAVITQSQLSQALEQAIFNTGLLEAIREGGNVYLDGKEIAQSKNFKNEINRTNPSLNIR